MWMTGDPLADFNAWDAEQQRRLEQLPCCARCDQRIQQDMAVCIDGDYYCDECLGEMRVVIGGD